MDYPRRAGGPRSKPTVRAGRDTSGKLAGATPPPSAVVSSANPGQIASKTNSPRVETWWLAVRRASAEWAVRPRRRLVRSDAALPAWTEPSSSGSVSPTQNEEQASNASSNRRPSARKWRGLARRIVDRTGFQDINSPIRPSRSFAPGGGLIHSMGGIAPAHPPGHRAFARRPERRASRGRVVLAAAVLLAPDCQPRPGPLRPGGFGLFAGIRHAAGGRRRVWAGPGRSHVRAGVEPGRVSRHARRVPGARSWARSSLLPVLIFHD